MNQYHLLYKSPTEQLLVLFYKCTHWFLYRNGQDIGKKRVMSILYRRGDMTQRKLLDRTGIRSASLSTLLSKIEANGYIRRERCPEDARNVNIMLTDAGKAEGARIVQEQIQFAQRLFSALDEHEKIQLVRLLGKLFASWKAENKLEGRENEGYE